MFHSASLLSDQHSPIASLINRKKTKQVTVQRLYNQNCYKDALSSQLEVERS